MYLKEAVFQPEDIGLMRQVLDEAASLLPASQQTSTIKAELASRILALAAQGERDPNKLRAAALLALARNCNYPSHDISPARRAV